MSVQVPPRGARNCHGPDDSLACAVREGRRHATQVRTTASRNAHRYPCWQPAGQLRRHPRTACPASDGDTGETDRLVGHVTDHRAGLLRRCSSSDYRRFSVNSRGCDRRGPRGPPTIRAAGCGRHGDAHRISWQPPATETPVTVTAVLVKLTVPLGPVAPVILRPAGAVRTNTGERRPRGRRRQVR